MSEDGDQEEKQETPQIQKSNRVVDGITPNGENAFTSPRLGIALVIKPELTAGDLERWLKDFRLIEDGSVAFQRLALFFGAVQANIFIHCTDKPTRETMKAVNGQHALWYGAQLIGVYNRYTVIDPN